MSVITCRLFESHVTLRSLCWRRWLLYGRPQGPHDCQALSKGLIPYRLGYFWTSLIPGWYCHPSLRLAIWTFHFYILFILTSCFLSKCRVSVAFNMFLSWWRYLDYYVANKFLHFIWVCLSAKRSAVRSRPDTRYLVRGGTVRGNCPPLWAPHGLPFPYPQLHPSPLPPSWNVDNNRVCL